MQRCKISRAGKSLISVAEAQQADVDKAVHVARIAFDKGPWPRMSGGFESCYLHQVEILPLIMFQALKAPT